MLKKNSEEHFANVYNVHQYSLMHSHFCLEVEKGHKIFLYSSMNIYLQWRERGRVSFQANCDFAFLVAVVVVCFDVAIVVRTHFLCLLI